MIDEPDDLARAIEAALFAADAPMTIVELATALGQRDGLATALARVKADYAGRGVNLVERGGHWHFQTAPDLAHILRREREEPRRLSRAGVETLAIIAYHEPVSRAEIEAIRGVQISKGTLDVLMEAGWGAPRRPARGAGATLALCDDAGVPRPFRAGEPPATCRGSRICAPPGCSIRSIWRSKARWRRAVASRRWKKTTRTTRWKRTQGDSSWVASASGIGLSSASSCCCCSARAVFSDMMGDVAKGLKSFKKGMSEDDHDDVVAPRPATRLQAQPPVDPNPDRELHPIPEDRPTK